MQWITDKLLAFISNDKHLFLKAYINVAFDEAVGCHQTFLKANNSPFSGLASIKLRLIRALSGCVWDNFGPDLFLVLQTIHRRSCTITEKAPTLGPSPG